MGRLNGKVAVITGGTSGLGFATAKLFAEEGAVVCALGRNLENGRKKISELKNCGTAVFYQADVTNRSQIAQIYADIFEKYGRIDILVNNAGSMVAHGVMDECDPEKENIARNVMEINVFGTNICASEVIRYMRKGKGGSIIFMGSLGSELIFAPGDWAYIASKAAIPGLTREYAVAYGPDGIRSNCIQPSVVITEGAVAVTMACGATEEEARQEFGNPLQRPVQPIDIAKAALFFASDDSAAISGQILAVDGALSVSAPQF